MGFMLCHTVCTDLRTVFSLQLMKLCFKTHLSIKGCSLGAPDVGFCCRPSTELCPAVGCALITACPGHELSLTLYKKQNAEASHKEILMDPAAGSWVIQKGFWCLVDSSAERSVRIYSIKVHLSLETNILRES